MTLPSKIVSLFQSLKSETGFDLHDVTGGEGMSVYRQDSFGIILNSKSLTSDNSSLNKLKQVLRIRLRKLDWQCSEENDRPHLVVIAPMIVKDVDVAFHATRSVIVPSILTDGLLPSVPERSSTQRADCAGNIYVCPTLGDVPSKPDDEPKKETSQWWRWKLSQSNRFDDPNWSILRIDLGDIEAEIYKDIWSASGLIVDGIDCIPAERISVVWSPEVL